MFLEYRCAQPNTIMNRKESLLVKLSTVINVMFIRVGYSTNHVDLVFQIGGLLFSSLVYPVKLHSFLGEVQCSLVLLTTLEINSPTGTGTTRTGISSNQTSFHNFFQPHLTMLSC